LEQGYNKSVDWWSYGVLLYEMRLRFEPFKGCDEDELYDCILDGEADYPPCLERELVSLIQKV
jgi:serine/threonine protein kinase